MPKDNIDYSNTIIYKIYCKDENIKEVYVGHTTNFSQRKYAHKISCEKDKNLKIYGVIRKNGGWENWDMIEIAKYECKDSSEARIKEQYHFNLMQYDFNSCNQNMDKTNYKNTHNITPKIHNIIKQKSSEKGATDVDLHKNPQKCNYKYECNKCYYYSNNFKDYSKHLMTPKHIKLTGSNENTDDFSPKSQNIYKCDCDKIYKHRQSLFTHKKKCNKSCSNDDKEEPQKINDLVITIMKEFMNSQKEIMKEQQNMMVQVLKNSAQHNTTNNVNNNNSHNKTFNLQLFLNETCKDAMNIMDFVESVKLQVADLENVGKVGYIEGISNIIIKNLNAMDVNKRPVHCADQKREVMYVKDENIWEKEDENNKKLRKAIRMIAHKNICMLKDFRDKYPDCQDYDSKKNDQYNKIVYESMGGKGDDDYDKDTKIIKKIAKQVTITKDKNY